MGGPNHDLARKFLAALSAGELPDSLLTPDMTAWTTTRGTAAKAAYQGGVKMLGGLFDGGYCYAIQSLTAEEDRVAAEVFARGKLIDGRDFENTYVFILRIRDGRIASVAEHFNPGPVQERIVPLIQARMAKSAG